MSVTNGERGNVPVGEHLCALKLFFAMKLDCGFDTALSLLVLNKIPFIRHKTYYQRVKQIKNKP